MFDYDEHLQRCKRPMTRPVSIIDTNGKEKAVSKLSGYMIMWMISCHRQNHLHLPLYLGRYFGFYPPRRCYRETYLPPHFAKGGMRTPLGVITLVRSPQINHANISRHIIALCRLYFLSGFIARFQVDNWYCCNPSKSLILSLTAYLRFSLPSWTLRDQR